MIRTVAPVSFGALLFVGLLGCGGGQAKFAESFVEQYCADFTSCDRVGRRCPVELDDAGLVYKDCDFDKDLAEECLAATFTCDASIPEYAILILPDACTQVCGDVLLPGSE